MHSRSDDQSEHCAGFPCAFGHDHCSHGGGGNHLMTKGGIKGSYLRLSQAWRLGLRVVKTEIEEMVLPALMHIRMLFY
tara:strand:+ start:11503 stop:11736 length:234 start_codon:yes stop_codon:yes gene_type:complete